jgi:hypothetical protein
MPMPRRECNVSGSFFDPGRSGWGSEAPGSAENRGWLGTARHLGAPQGCGAEARCNARALAGSGRSRHRRTVALEPGRPAMRDGSRPGLIGVTALLMALALISPACAVEYGLRIVSVYDSAYASYLKPGEFQDGGTGPGLDRLEASFDRGELGAGAILFDRRVQPVPGNIARAYGGTPVVGTLSPGGGGRTWDEVTWEGNPGERSVWLIAASSRAAQELERTALKTMGPLRNFRVYTLPPDRTRLPAIAFPLNFLWSLEEHGSAWDRYLARSLDLQYGVGVVIGQNFNPHFPDQAYIIVSQGEQPSTSKVVLVWRDRSLDRELPGTRIFR